MSRNHAAPRPCAHGPIVLGEALGEPLSPNLRQALRTLYQAYKYAQQAQRDVWDFAVEIGTLRAHGLNETDLRWLLCMGYVSHARESTKREDDGREFRPLGNLSFARRTCFVVTDRGISVAKLLEDRSAAVMLGRGMQDLGQRERSADISRAERNGVRGAFDGGCAGNGCMPHMLPTWDNVRRELWLNGQLVKRFRWPAANQETILAAFEEEGWPAHLDDPLPPQPAQDSKRRLHDSIKCLNRNQVAHLLRFLGDGTGEGVFWEIVTGWSSLDVVGTE